MRWVAREVQAVERADTKAQGRKACGVLGLRNRRQASTDSRTASDGRQAVRKLRN